MQIVIDIPKNTYDRIAEGGAKCHFIYKLDLMRAILKGTPLPKGHGRLIDADSLLDYGSCPNSCDGTTTCMESYEHLHCPIRVFDIESINDAPTIIEADKEMKHADDN